MNILVDVDDGGGDHVQAVQQPDQVNILVDAEDDVQDVQLG